MRVVDRAMAIRIVLADDHRIFREGIVSLLGKFPDMDVVAQADDGREAIQRALELRPSVVIMDVAMPGLNGIDATLRLHQEAPDTAVLALSMHSDRRFVTAMLRAGASGYLLKTCPSEELIAAIRTVARRQVYLSPAVADVVVDELLRGSGTSTSPEGDALTAREREVLQLLAEGKATKQIANELRVSIKTIETYRRQIMQKLDIDSVAGLTKYAIREGITSLED